MKVGKCQRRFNLWLNATLSRLPRHLLLKLMVMTLTWNLSLQLGTLIEQHVSGYCGLVSNFSVDALKWTNLEEGQSTALSLQREDGSCCTAWACGMLSTELLLNPMLLVNLRLFVVAIGKKVSKAHGRTYNSYKLMSL